MWVYRWRYKSLLLNSLPEEYNAVKANARVSSNIMTAEEGKDQILEQYRVSCHESDFSKSSSGNSIKSYATRHKNNSNKPKDNLEGKKHGGIFKRGYIRKYGKFRGYISLYFSCEGTAHDKQPLWPSLDLGLPEVKRKA